MNKLNYFLIGLTAMVVFSARAEVLSRVDVLVAQLAPPAGVFFELNQKKINKHIQSGTLLVEQVEILKNRFPTLDVVVILEQDALEVVQIKNHKSQLYQALKRLSKRFNVSTRIDAKSAASKGLDERHFPSYVHLQDDLDILIIDFQRRRYERIPF